jgi:hypothetical protein
MNPCDIADGKREEGSVAATPICGTNSARHFLRTLGLIQIASQRWTPPALGRTHPRRSTKGVLATNRSARCKMGIARIAVIVPRTGTALDLEENMFC